MEGVPHKEGVSEGGRSPFSASPRMQQLLEFAGRHRRRGIYLRDRVSAMGRHPIARTPG